MILLLPQLNGNDHFMVFFTVLFCLQLRRVWCGNEKQVVLLGLFIANGLSMQKVLFS